MTGDDLDLVIFDCDGVLVDSERICVEVDAVIMADLGVSFTEAEIVELFVGSSAEVFTAVVEERLGRPLERGWQRKYEHLYDAALADRLTAVDGVTQALADLTVPVCAASNGDRDGIHRSLRIAALSDHFEGRVFSAADVPRGKPAPDLFLHAARSMGADPARCAVIEDSAYGVQAARAAGMRAFGYCGGLTPAARLAGPGTVVFDDMRELPGLLAARDAGR
ncbi:HAD family hydrolase [Streptomyces xantholiticus]|uniref:HAD family hydrolase n=1 Tax=Streptomyces xantholiticus TaxID=68285 RepID=UPI00167A146F|nr:HAD family hydrolase [Streptomyces xantholiticus]GGW25596.1 haloacid dehalogenase [Streptomyces xantholiticus]